MTLEWSIAGALLLRALAPVAMRWRSPIAWAAVIAVAAMSGAHVRRNAAARPAVLLETSGAVQQDKFSALLRQRDNRSLELLE